MIITVFDKFIFFLSIFFGTVNLFILIGYAFYKINNKKADLITSILIFLGSIVYILIYCEVI